MKTSVILAVTACMLATVVAQTPSTAIIASTAAISSSSAVAPGTSSAPVPPASTSSAPVPPAPTSSAPAPPAPTSSAPAPPAPTSSAPAPPAPTSSAPAPPAPTSSAPVPPAPTSSAPAPPASSSAPAPKPTNTPAPISDSFEFIFFGDPSGSSNKDCSVGEVGQAASSISLKETGGMCKMLPGSDKYYNLQVGLSNGDETKIEVFDYQCTDDQCTDCQISEKNIHLNQCQSSDKSSFIFRQGNDRCVGPASSPSKKDYVVVQYEGAPACNPALALSVNIISAGKLNHCKKDYDGYTQITKNKDNQQFTVLTGCDDKCENCGYTFGPAELNKCQTGAYNIMQASDLEICGTSKSSSNQAGAIAGAIIGVVLAMALFGFVYMRYFRGSRSSYEPIESAS